MVGAGGVLFHVLRFLLLAGAGLAQRDGLALGHWTLLGSKVGLLMMYVVGKATSRLIYDGLLQG